MPATSSTHAKKLCGRASKLVLFFQIFKGNHQPSSSIFKFPLPLKRENLKSLPINSRTILPTLVNISSISHGFEDSGVLFRNAFNKNFSSIIISFLIEHYKGNDYPRENKRPVARLRGTNKRNNMNKYKPLVILDFDNWAYHSTDGVQVSTCHYCKLYLTTWDYHKGLLRRILELLRRSLTNSLKPSQVSLS